MTRRLTGLDSAFLALETHAAHMHVAAAVTLDAVAGEPADFDALRAHLAPRLASLPIFRRHLHEVPLGLDHPVWLERDFDLDAHLRRAALPSPGSSAELAAFLEHVTEMPLDRDRPLWEMWVVEGLEGGRTALVAKIHHALLDGVAAAEIFARLFDREAEPAPDAAPSPSAPPAEAAPSLPRMLFAAGRSLARKPVDLARQSIYGASAAVRGMWVGKERRPGPPPAVPSSTAAPISPLGGAITARRAVRIASVPFEELRAVKRAYQVKLNDVVLAVIADAMRRHLAARDEPTRTPLVAAIPVSIADDPSRHTSGNRVSAMTVDLPVEIADPVKRLLEIHRATQRSKRAHRAVGGELLARWAELAPPALLSGLARLYSRLDLADRHPPVANLIVSNVPGPPFRLYCAGHRIRTCHPLGPIYEGCAMNWTVISYDGQMHFGVVTCPDAVPGLDGISDAVETATAELARTARSVAGSRRRRARAAPGARSGAARAPARGSASREAGTAPGRGA